MANPEKGEFLVTIAGNSYTFVLNMGAMIALEDAVLEHMKVALTFDQIMELLAKGSAKAFGIFVWAMLKTHHPEKTVADVHALINDAGGPNGLRDILMKHAYEAALPHAEDMKELGIKPRPRKAQPKKATRSGGATSTSRRARSV